MSGVKLRRQPVHNGRSLGGRPIRVPRTVNSVRAILRRHLHEEGRRMQDLAEPWQCKKVTVYGVFHDARPISPQHIDAAIAWLQLDEFDAAELRVQGAREAGWKIEP